MPGTAFNSANWSGYDSESWTNPASALTDFTGLINIATLSSSWKAAIQSDGADIRVTKDDNTELPLDLIDFAYNAGAPTGWIRFKWTGTLATSGTQTVRVWAGYTIGTAVAYDATETYGKNNAYDANWLGYWPMHEDPSGSAPQIKDRTSNARNLTSNGSMTSGDVVAGKVGNALDFDGTDDANADYLSGTAPSLGTTFTLMAWAKPVTGINQGAINAVVTTGNNWQNGATLGYGLTTNRFDFYPIASYNALGVGGGTNSTVDAWYHAAGVLNGTAAEIFRNGASDGTATVSGTPTHGFMRVGASATAYSFRGQIDDVQVHNTVRAAGWIAEEYSQSNDNAAFWGTWAWTAAVAGHPAMRRLGMSRGGILRPVEIGHEGVQVI